MLSFFIVSEISKSISKVLSEKDVVKATLNIT